MFDRAELVARCGGDVALAEELVALFRRDLLPAAAALPALAEPAERAAEAHRLRGASLAIGAGEMAALAAHIEEGGSSDGFDAALARLSAALDAGLG